ncbi:hypothetical protein [Paraclostridium tenue]|uniref:DUF5348 domain-containing protein n=1 Tax=Paraclostridium tenue TaxID=1737 RepID=A0ABP3XG43_9FIRM|nr:hypothetical protein [[Eubacterium] tenue]MBC8630756.1 hypothetical protein [[Eubacterium] tenue]
MENVQYEVLENIINKLEDIINFKNNRNSNCESAEYILSKLKNEMEGLEDYCLYPTFFNSLDLFDANEDNINYNYILENIETIYKEIETYYSYNKYKLYEDGYIFTSTIKQNDYSFVNCDDALQNDWIQIDELEDLCVINGNGSLHGSLANSKKIYEDINMYY